MADIIDIVPHIIQKQNIEASNAFLDGVFTTRPLVRNDDVFVWGEKIDYDLVQKLIYRGINYDS
jgi:hypothetical protein